MKARITPFLWLDGQAEQAARFYAGVFRDARIVTVSHYGDAGPGAAGGQIHQCGWLTDRFGVTWQVVPAVLDTLLRDPNAHKAQSVMRAMMKMVKLDIAGLQQAHSQG
jgi:predicted 3-demethylubiquinone-9 3-methyltransferase (glyoxalase superfamily)